MGERLTILSWLWSQPDGKARYVASHVNIWAGMVARHLSIDHEICCVTDQPKGIDPSVRIIPLPADFGDVRIPTWGAGRPQCFRRLSLFHPDAARIFGGDYLVSMDLDVVVTASLDPLFARREDFRICRGTHSSRSFNGSMYGLRSGSRPNVYTDFTPERAVIAGRKHIGSDQSWIAHCLAGAPTWGVEHGVACIQQQHLSKNLRLLTFPGPLKPWVVAQLGRDALLARHYRGSRDGRCLLLGYGETLWDDVDAALDGGSIGGVIASREARAHWPGPVLAIADDDPHAVRLAVMHGFSDVVFCGRTGGQIDGAAR